LLGILLGIFYIRPVIDGFPPPGRYQILVGTGVLFFALSLFSVWMVQEEADHGLPNQRDASWTDYLRDLAAILRRRRDFRRFMGALMVSWLPLLLMASFLAKYGLTHAGVQKGVAGTYTVFRSASLGAGAFVAGVLTDRMGMLMPFRMVPAVLLAAAATAAISPHPAVVCAAFVLFGFAFGIRMVVVLPAVFRYAGPHRRPSYMALSFTLLGLASIAVPPLAGWLLDAGLLTFRMLFVGCGVLSVIGFLLFLRVAEPQTERAEGTAV
jgi:Na+/melibiose symporter-like transporter